MTNKPKNRDSLNDCGPAVGVRAECAAIIEAAGDRSVSAPLLRRQGSPLSAAPCSTSTVVPELVPPSAPAQPSATASLASVGALSVASGPRLLDATPAELGELGKSDGGCQQEPGTRPPGEPCGEPASSATRNDSSLMDQLHSMTRAPCPGPALETGARSVRPLPAHYPGWLVEEVDRLDLENASLREQVWRLHWELCEANERNERLQMELAAHDGYESGEGEAGA